MGLHIALVDVASSDGWHGPSSLFQEAARALSAQGHDVQSIDDTVITNLQQDIPLLTGLNRAVAVRPMIDSHRLAQELARRPPDVMIAPLRGGIAQAALMARSCGEAFAGTRIVLWGNQPSRDRFLIGDAMTSDLSPLIADALERQCLALADALVLPDSITVAPSFPGLDLRIPLVRCPRKTGAGTTAGAGTQIREIVFMGAFQRSTGAGEFIEAIEQLARTGRLGDKLVTFLGPVTDSAQGLSKEWLGQKAAAWSFRFRVVDETEKTRAILYASEPGRLVVGLSPDSDDLHALRACNRNHVAFAARPMSDPRLARRLADAIAVAIEDNGTADNRRDEVDWADLLATVTGLEISPQRSGTDSVTVCVLHYNRLDFLRQALASIPRAIEGRDVEILVIDNASPIADVERAIREAAGDRAGLRILALSEPLPQAAAYNRGMAEARSEIVVFLDDDNLFLADGLERLARAASTGAHDIVVTSLDIFDDGEGDPRTIASAGRLLFLGPAHSAGLFFNAFGDTAMAVRRTSFTALGGFHELGYDYPSLDWVTLAKAQGAGLRIGALQWPAVRYRRNTARADIQSIKLDEAGARALVFEACRDSIDTRLVARHAQQLQLADL